MQQLTGNVFVETHIRGCNHGFATTSDGIVMIDSPHKPSDALKLKAEIAKRGQLRYIIYPMDVGQDGMEPMVMKLNVANLYNYLTGA